MRELLRRYPFASGLVGAIAGLAVGLLVIHTYFDHKALHDLVNMVNANAEKAKP